MRGALMRQFLKYSVQKIYKRDKVIPDYITQSYRGTRGVDPLVLHLCTTQR